METRDVVWLLYNARNLYASLTARVVASYWGPGGEQTDVPFNLERVGGGFRPKLSRPDFIVRSSVRLSKPWQVELQQSTYANDLLVRQIAATIVGDGLKDQRATHDLGGTIPALPTAFEFMFDPARLLSSFDVQLSGDAHLNGIHCGLVRAVRRDGVLRSAAPSGVAAALECRCAVDLQRGILRAATVWLRSSESAYFEVEELAFDDTADTAALAG